MPQATDTESRENEETTPREPSPVPSPHDGELQKHRLTASGGRRSGNGEVDHGAPISYRLGEAPQWKRETLDNVEIYASFVSGDKLAILGDLVRGVPRSQGIDERDANDLYFVVVCQMEKASPGKRVLWLDLEITNEGADRYPPVQLLVRFNKSAREYHVIKMDHMGGAHSRLFETVPTFRATRVAVK